jgi:hypothetical protein
MKLQPLCGETLLISLFEKWGQGQGFTERKWQVVLKPKESSLSQP